MDKIEKKLKCWMWGGYGIYFATTIFNLVVPFAFAIIRWTVNDLRNFVALVPKPCDVNLFWLDDDDFEVSFQCHYEQEWALLYLSIMNDILLVLFCLWLPFTLIFMAKAFKSKYFVDKEKYEIDYKIMGIKH